MSKPYSRGVKLASGIAPNGDYYVADGNDVRFSDERSVTEELTYLRTLLAEIKQMIIDGATPEEILAKFDEAKFDQAKFV